MKPKDIMRFTAERKLLIRLLQVVGQKMPGQKRADKRVRLTACSPRVFVEANSTTAGTEALVLQDGTCSIDLKPFLAMLNGYENKEHLMFEAGPNWIKFGATILNTAGYSPRAEAPGEIQSVPLTVRWRARAASPPW